MWNTAALLKYFILVQKNKAHIQEAPKENNNNKNSEMIVILNKKSNSWQFIWLNTIRFYDTLFSKITQQE